MSTKPHWSTINRLIFLLFLSAWAVLCILSWCDIRHDCSWRYLRGRSSWCVRLQHSEKVAVMNKSSDSSLLSCYSKNPYGMFTLISIRYNRLLHLVFYVIFKVLMNKYPVFEKRGCVEAWRATLLFFGLATDVFLSWLLSSFIHSAPRRETLQSGSLSCGDVWGLNQVTTKEAQPGGNQQSDDRVKAKRPSSVSMTLRCDVA